MRRCGGLRSTGSGSSKTLEFEMELGETPVEAEVFIAAVACCFFSRGAGFGSFGWTQELWPPDLGRRVGDRIRLAFVPREISGRRI
jgi:hypothetical protein